MNFVCMRMSMSMQDDEENIIAKTQEKKNTKQITFVRFGWNEARVWVNTDNKAIFVVKLISDNIIYCQSFVFLFL